MRNEIDVSFGDITKENINHLRKMNASLFPVRYPESFYADVPLSNPDFNQYGKQIRIPPTFIPQLAQHQAGDRTDCASKSVNPIHCYLVQLT